MKKEAQSKFGKKDSLILLLIILVAFLFRIYKLNTPLADFHSWRQADTAAVARNFVNKGFNLMRPTYDDLSNTQTGHDNPEGLRFVEFPLYNAKFALLYSLFPFLSLEAWGRLTTIFSSLVVITILYYFLLKEVGRVAAIIGSLTYAVFPFFVFFSRVVLPETTALSLVFISLLFLYLYSFRKNKVVSVVFYIISMVFFALSLLVKPTVIFYAISLAYLFCLKHGWKVLKRIEFYLYFALSILPLVLWRRYISSFPEGVPASEWLLTSVNTYQGLQTIFFKPAFFRWIFFERINNLILGGFLTVFAVLGALSKNKRYFLLSIVVSAALYLFTFQGGNVQHEYYQTLIFPALVILVAQGLNLLLTNNRLLLSRTSTYTAVFIIFLFSFFVSYYSVKNYYNYSTELVNIAKIVRDLTQKEDKIVTDRTGDTTLLYLTERRGSPAMYKEPSEFKRDGYKYMVILNRETINNLKTANKFSIVFENDKFAIFQL